MSFHCPVSRYFLKTTFQVFKHVKALHWWWAIENVRQRALACSPRFAALLQVLALQQRQEGRKTEKVQPLRSLHSSTYSIFATVASSFHSSVQLAQEPGSPIWRARRTTEKLLVLSGTTISMGVHTSRVAASWRVHFQRTRGHSLLFQLSKQWGASDRNLCSAPTGFCSR